MGKRDWSILPQLKQKDLVLESFWLDFSLKIDGMSMNLHYLHSLHQIAGFHRGK